jgi:hypothetical protein
MPLLMGVCLACFKCTTDDERTKGTTEKLRKLAFEKQMAAAVSQRDERRVSGIRRNGETSQ